MELVVLVDEKNQEIGTAPKEAVHTTDTPLHRAFSLFLFNSKKELLLAQRAFSKKTFPGVWSNTVCGHPAPGESVVGAAKRRLHDELGIDLDLKQFQEVAPYRYRFVDQNGIVENEVCPIVVAVSDATPNLNPHEVQSSQWISWEQFLKEIAVDPKKYSPWSVEEATLLEEKRGMVLF